VAESSEFEAQRGGNGRGNAQGARNLRQNSGYFDFLNADDGRDRQRSFRVAQDDKLLMSLEA